MYLHWLEPVGRTSGVSNFVPVVDFSYCSRSVRGVILEAGRLRRMVKMEYSGYTRLVEPYRLEYYVRKKDGIGNEYFWGWDTTGGSSRKTGIKMFFADKIQSVVVTDQTYTPKYPVEL